MARIFYDCTKCLAYCCSIYERVKVTPRDLKRIAKHFGLSVEEAGKRYIKFYRNVEMNLRRKQDPVLGECCIFLDTKTRGCTIYEARPKTCREYPDRPRCGYYDILKFEREQQDDPMATPLVQITFRVENGSEE